MHARDRSPSVDGNNSEYPGYNTRKIHLERLPLDEKDCKEDIHTLQRAAQMTVPMIAKIALKFTRSEAFLMDSCQGMLSTEKACLMIPHHRRFVGCDVVKECLKNALPSLLLVFCYASTES